MKRKIVPMFLATLLLLIAGCTFWRIVKYGESGVYDFNIFSSRPLYASPQPFVLTASDEQLPKTISFAAYHDVDLDRVLADNGTLAFLVLHNDRLIAERYYNGHRRETLSMSFSMAKSFLSILIGCAIADGLIESVEQPVTDFVPELRSAGYDRVTIRHLLQMTSGMNYTEADNPFGLHPHFYYSENLVEDCLALTLRDEPGAYHSYKSGENELLGLVLTRALGGPTITAYMQERLWEPLGMQYGGLYSTDRPGGIEKTFCCLSARAIDFLKFGRLYLHEGEWNGRQLVPRQWVRDSTKIDETQGSAWFYQYGWWIMERESGDYRASGHLGQYLFISPSRDMVILRLGEDKGRLSTEDWSALLFAVRDAVAGN